jgi:hypothetical protein
VHRGVNPSSNLKGALSPQLTRRDGNLPFPLGARQHSLTAWAFNARTALGYANAAAKSNFLRANVLQNFTGEERTLWVEPLLAAIAETIPLLVSGAPDAFMSEVARRFTPPNDRMAEDPAQP